MDIALTSPGEEDRFLNLIDLDRLFDVSPNAIILNHIDYTNINYVEMRNSRIYARSGELNFVAHCDCENLVGNQLIGIRCPKCGTEVRDDFGSDAELNHNTWLSIPQSIKGVLHPAAYLVLSAWFSGNKRVPNFIDIACDPTIEIPPKYHGIILEQGHNYFYNNFDNLMEQLLAAEKNPQKKRMLQTFLTNYRPVMFCTKLPVMSSVLHSITSADGGGEGRQYADAGSQVILDAATDLATLESALGRSRPNAVSSVLQRVYKSYIGYVSEIAAIRLSKKKSLIRRHMLGTRLHLSFRTVIIPHKGRYNEIYLPWSLSVNLLKLHIINRLMHKHGMLLGEAILAHVVALVCYDERIHQIINELIEESKFPGLPCLINRNPSLRRGAVQLLYFTKVITDLSVKTMSISTMVLSDPNAKYEMAA